MSVAMQAFGFEDQLVRVVDKSGAPWFIAQDVCSCLDIGNSRQAIVTLEDDEKGVITTDTLGGAQEVNVISESGVYVLIFRSRKPVAKRFRKWVTAEVLPTLRRTGQYIMGVPANDDAAPALPDAETESPDERATIIALQVVREARQVFGRQMARKIWAELGLPGMAPGTAGAGGKVTQYKDRVDPTITGWLNDCARRQEGVTSSAMLWRSYQNWCAGQEFEGVSQTVFGCTLHALGFHPLKAPNDNGRISRSGIVLI